MSWLRARRSSDTDAHRGRHYDRAPAEAARVRRDPPRLSGRRHREESNGGARAGRRYRRCPAGVGGPQRQFLFRLRPRRQPIRRPAEQSDGGTHERTIRRSFSARGCGRKSGSPRPHGQTARARPGATARARSGTPRLSSGTRRGNDCSGISPSASKRSPCNARRSVSGTRAMCSSSTACPTRSSHGSAPSAPRNCSSQVPMPLFEPYRPQINDGERPPVVEDLLIRKALPSDVRGAGRHRSGPRRRRASRTRSEAREAARQLRGG